MKYMDTSKAKEYLKHRGFGKGTNYTTNLVAGLMQDYHEKQVKNCDLADVGGNEVTLPSLAKVGAYLEKHFDESQEPFYQSQVAKYYTVTPYHIKTLIDSLIEGNGR